MDYISDRSVALVLTGRPDTVFIASSVCVGISNRYFLATAGHNLEDISSLDQVRLLPRGQRGRGDAAVLAFRKSVNHDVAFLEISEQYVSRAGIRYLNLTDLKHGQRHDPTTAFIIQGFPCREVAVHSPDDIEPISIALLTCSVSADDKRGRLVLEYPPQSAQDKGLELVAPHGISGGGIWSYPSFIDNLVWAPDASKLVAIATHWIDGKGHELAEPIEHWLELIATEVSDLRSLIFHKVEEG